MDQDAVSKQSFINALSMPVLVFDHKGRIQAANTAVVDMLKVSSEDLLSKTMQDVDSAFDRQHCTQYISELKQVSSCTAAGHLRSQTGQIISVKYLFTSVVEDGADHIIAFIQERSSQLHRDSQVEILETELRRVTETAASANRVKREFIANMNHEIRAPMNAIIGYAEMLAASNLGEREQRFVQTIQKSGATLLSIVNDVMELSKLEAGKLRIARIPTRLQSLVDEAGKLFSDQIQAKSLEFICTVQPDLPEVFLLDEAHCRQILINLLSNAFKFTTTGTITLAVTGAPAASGGFDLQFRVTDTGIGIAALEQKVIFDLLEQQDKPVGRQGGKRLGLTLCARLALMMGGHLSLDSMPGKGSSFLLTLPAKEVGEETVSTVVQPQQASEPEQDERVPVLLVVDDMPMISDIIIDYFSRDSIQVLVADNSEDCVLLAKEHRPNLVLMDLNLAGVDGREVTRRLKKDDETARIPVVVMTGKMLDEEDYQTVFDGFLAKPFHLAELQEIVDRFVYRPVEKSPPSSAEQRPPEQDTAFVAAAWSEQLSELLAGALVSGSLDATGQLGTAMVAQGRKKDSLQLVQMGRKLESYATAPDILGVEQLLSFLNKQTGESE